MSYEPSTKSVALAHLAIIVVTILAIAVITASVAWSASQEYCRPYATNLTEKVIKRIWTTFYATCLNQDEDPTEPTDWPAIADIINQEGIGVVPATDKLPEPKPRPEKAPDPEGLAPDVCGRPASGFAIASSEQTRWCKSHFRSFRSKDGTVVCSRPRKRVPCA
jgi:hypothetical protein